MASSLLIILISNGDEAGNTPQSKPQCGRCQWEAEGWPDVLKTQTPLTIKTPCGHLGNIPGCYTCGTRSDVAVHTCKPTTGGNAL